MAFRLTWTDNNGPDFQEDGFKVYRDVAPMNPSALPAPIATLPADTTQWDDVSPLASAYYRVSAFKGAVEAVSDEISMSSGGGGGGAANFRITIPASNISADIAAFTTPINLSHMPVDFWSSVSAGGANVRAFAADGTTGIPIDVSYVNTSMKVGMMFVRTDLSAAVDNEIVVKVLDAATPALPVTDPLGRDACHAGAEVVLAFPDTANRTGKAYVPHLADIQPPTEWIRSLYKEFAGNPHQGIATDSTGRVITIDTNHYRRYDAADLTTLLAENTDPAASTGIAGVTHSGDGCIIGNELFIPIEADFVSPFDNQHIAVFDADTLAFKRSYDITANAHEVSGIAYDGTNLWISDWTDGTVLRKYSLTGTLLETVTLSAAQTKIQGVEVVDGKLYISPDISGNPIVEIEFDGTVNGEVYRRPTAGINEGLSFDGTSLWVMDEGGDAEKLSRDPRYQGWARLHKKAAWMDIDTPSQAWTMDCHMVWQAAAEYQQGLIGMANGSSDSNRGGLLFDQGPPNVLGMWSSADGWAHSTTTMNAYDEVYLATAYDGATYRKAWQDGAVIINDGPVSARPVGATAQMIINASETAQEQGEGYYGLVRLYHSAQSDAWVSASSTALREPSTFYSVAVI